jgi:hypothetical protein
MIFFVSGLLTTKMEQVYRWCAQLESLRTELSKNHERERVTSVRQENVESLMAACNKCNATCVKLGPVKTKVSHHGGSYYVDEEQIRITFQ